MCRPGVRSSAEAAPGPNQRVFAQTSGTWNLDIEKGDAVVLAAEHSEFDGATGQVTPVSDTMFGDATYIIQFDEGQEAGISADQLELAAETESDE